ncbi:hypothetical protein OUZ56_018553 [Daphnia magna]|uniref:Uncharacterized protein n=1 Tax=Daphnia magna TaxID=35525 RepID=A0ABQ9Z967_9CRUS|nr:hypothetical protein OUZ56_018553 [Daphnia magna]
MEKLPGIAVGDGGSRLKLGQGSSGCGVGVDAAGGGAAVVSVVPGTGIYSTTSERAGLLCLGCCIELKQKDIEVQEYPSKAGLEFESGMNHIPP